MPNLKELVIGFMLEHLNKTTKDDFEDYFTQQMIEGGCWEGFDQSLLTPENHDELRANYEIVAREWHLNPRPQTVDSLLKKYAMWEGNKVKDNFLQQLQNKIAKSN